MSSTFHNFSILLVLLTCIFQTCSATSTVYSSWWSMWYLWVVIIIILSCCGGCIGHYRRQKMLKRTANGRQIFVVQAQQDGRMPNPYMTTPPPPGAYPQQPYPGNFNQGFMPMPEPAMKPPSYDEAVRPNQTQAPSAAPQGNATPTSTTVDMPLPSNPPPYQK